MRFSPSFVAALALSAGVSAEDDSFDYIVVGGGTAGTALATRLSLGLPKSTILLIEAGPAALDDLRINVPGLRGSILGTSLDWNFTTVKQSSLDGRSISVNRGKVLGGSSAMNYLCYDRASAPEYEAWAELGNPGWGWNTMVKAMTKSENFTGTDKDRHGRNGPIQNYYNRVVYPVLRFWQPAVSKLGINVNDHDSMGGDPIGVGLQPTNIDTKKNTRSYSASSYLPLAGKNLVVRTNTQVAKVNLVKLKDSEYKATGVALPGGEVIRARKEVIISAGSVQSPGLLELSGFGQPAVLKAAGVTPLVNLPGVGENYQDHIRLSNTYRLKDGIDSFDNLIFDSAGANATGELQKWVEGELSLYEYTTSAYGFMNWRQLGLDVKMKKIARDVFGRSANVIDAKKLQYLNNARVPSIEMIYEANFVGSFGYTGGKFITLIATVMQPFSRGSVHIDPSDPRGKPIIDPKFMSNKYDHEGLVEAAKFSRRIAHSEPIKSTWVAETEPGEDIQTDEDWRAYAKTAMGSFYHPVGTCAMLPRKNGGVVSPELLVYGTTNLRVVDNSIIPIIPAAHIQTAAYGIAEVAAAKIIASA
ncbi:choline dehydrogenase [Microdochium trichocladiopsis]|uniref:Choline dehydrogenase n=1 Tax=Microdochium trichocladiopsis TaxID=1682393 RepID=A0A9P9BFN0_9PEZI|nr:choline dehydrogenase [Microdochium trichocladiopsis]KAH7012441.1 choline dehydrogenase [Microdochium trichocladiopsis]